MDDVSNSPVAEGEIIAGKYRVARTLGVGGMGVVVAATHIDLNQKVALKFLLPQAAGHPELVERFAREARAAAQIRSEYVARVMDVGMLDTGSPYMVMEYLEGHDLHHGLKASGALPVHVAVGYVLHACEAIAEAHAIGIVHRDLKPANLFLANRPNGSTVIKVLDFGISKSTLTSDQADLTQGSTMVGSPSYMSPEQIRAAKTLDARADQWSLGVILYELISGQKPFAAQNMAELVWVILDQAHPPLRTLCPDVPAGLEDAIDRCLAKDGAHRFAHIAELAAAIAPFGPEWSFASARSTAHVLGVSTAAWAQQPSNPAIAQVTPLPLLGNALPVPAGLVPAATPVPPPALVPPAPPPAPVRMSEPGVTNAPWSQSSSSTPVLAAVRGGATRRLLIPAAIGALCAGAVIAGLVMTRTPGGTAPASVSTADSFSQAAAHAPPAVTAPLPAEAPPPPLPVIAAAPAPEPPPAASPPPESPQAAPPPEVAPEVVAKEAPREPAHARTATARAPAPAASAKPAKCQTVSYFDSDGMKHFKQECP